jgi:3'-phosphoadenosine 5'-phosphosulfate sulfotransferase
MMLEGAGQEAVSLELRPENPSYFLDGDYILASMGLLAQEQPEAALTILQKSLSERELTRRDN